MNIKHKLGFYGFFALASALALTNLVNADSSGTILPSSEGTYLQWTPKSGSTHYTMVDESSCNGLTDYNSTTTVGNRDSYGVVMSVFSIPNGSTITGISITPCASRSSSGSGSSTLKVFYRYNGANSADAGNYALTGTTPVQLAATTFSGLSLVKGPSSSLQIGAVYSAGTKGARLSRLAVSITYTPLNAPTNLDAVNVSSTQNNLTWTDNSSNEDGFKLERSVNGVSGPWNGFATTTSSIVSYSDTGLTPNQTYHYRARAFNAGGESAYSNVDYAITVQSVPNDPTNLIASVATSSVDILLNWTDNSSNEDGFLIERSFSGGSFSNIATTTANVVSYADMGLASGTYVNRVRAFNAGGFSGYSNNATSTIP